MKRIPVSKEHDEQQPNLSSNGEEEQQPPVELPEDDTPSEVPEQSGTDNSIPDWFIQQSIKGN